MPWGPINCYCYTSLCVLSPCPTLLLPHTVCSLPFPSFVHLNTPMYTIGEFCWLPWTLETWHVTQTQSVHMTTVNLDWDPDSSPDFNPDLTLPVWILSQGTTIVITMLSDVWLTMSNSNTCGGNEVTNL